MKSVVRRLLSGSDLKHELSQIVQVQRVAAAVVVSGVGSLSSVNLRLAGAGTVKSLTGPLEIVSITGTLSQAGLHVHLSVSDRSGTTYGGHLLDGSLVHTTVELVIRDLSAEWTFDREEDSNTGYRELVAKRRGQ